MILRIAVRIQTLGVGTAFPLVQKMSMGTPSPHKNICGMKALPACFCGIMCYQKSFDFASYATPVTPSVKEYPSQYHDSAFEFSRMLSNGA